MATAMFGGGRNGLFNFSRAAAFPNPSPPKSSRLCFQYARRSSQADSNESDYGDVKGKDSMKECVNKAEEEAEKAKEKTEEGSSAARDRAADAAEKTRDTMKAGFDKTKEKSKSMAEKAEKRAEEGAEKSKEGAQSIGKKAKQTVQGAWEAAKETTHKIKETVVGSKDEDALEDVGKAPPGEDVSAARNRAAEDQANKRGREKN